MRYKLYLLLVPVLAAAGLLSYGLVTAPDVARLAKANPNTTIAITKALIRAGMWLDANSNGNRPEAVKILVKPEYVGADYNVIANSMSGTYEY